MTFFIILFLVIILFALINKGQKKNVQQQTRFTNVSNEKKENASVIREAKEILPRASRNSSKQVVNAVVKNNTMTLQHLVTINSNLSKGNDVVSQEGTIDILGENEVSLINTNQDSNREESVVEVRENLVALDSTPVLVKEGDFHDDSIIDVSNTTGSIIDLEEETLLEAPYWPHRYIYSYEEIHHATKPQQDFYHQFKIEFLKGNQLFLRGNSNYSFILLFDLLQEFEQHKDFYKIENQLERLGNSYPVTKSYCISFLLQRLEKMNMYDEAQRFRAKNFQYDYDFWKLGRRYKEKLNLSETQAQILNQTWLSNNVFNEIEYCRIEILKQFLRAVDCLNEKVPYDTSFSNLVEELSDLVVRKYYKYRKGSQNYRYTIDSVKSEIYNHILKLSENNIRDFYGNKRKLAADFNYRTPEIFSSYREKVISTLELFLLENQKEILNPDLETEKLLNESNTTRWKLKYESLIRQFEDSKSFEQEILKLAKENEKNPSVENIFFEASKFITKYDKISALSLYINYVDKDLDSVKVDNKQLTKTIQKSLFKTSDQLNDFEKILSDFIKDRNISAAKEKVENIYASKRKKIVIDSKAISEVEKQHSQAIELLNEYLQDDETSDALGNSSIEIEKDEVIQIHFEREENTKVLDSKYISELQLTEIQTEVLTMLEKNSFSISQIDIENLLKSRSLMRGPVIDSINEISYELLDDVLIEEEDGDYTIYPDYYKKLLKND